jgi:hypothetical protein
MGRKAIMVWGRMPLKRNVTRSGLIALLLALGALALAVVGLAATASTASADQALGPWSCPPPSAPVTGVGTIDQVPQECVDLSGSFDFGDRQVGTTSPAQRFGLGVYCISACNDTLNPRISVSGDYAQTNNCPPTLSATAPRQLQGCQINVTFAPTGTGPRHGTLSAGPGGPTVALTGFGFSATDSTPPDLQLSGKKKQSPQDDFPGCDRGACNVHLKVSCGDEKCTARAKGKLTNVKNDKLSPNGPKVVPPGETRTLGPELTQDRQREHVRKSLAEGENVQAKVTVRAKDAAGNVATAKRTITLVK